MRVYVLSNCDKCRAALKWLREQDIAHETFDIRKDGVGQNVIAGAIGELGWETVLNRRSTSWRALDEGARGNIDAEKAARLIADNVTLMKRPLFAAGDSYLSGFDEAVKAQLIALAK